MEPETTNSTCSNHVNQKFSFSSTCLFPMFGITLWNDRHPIRIRMQRLKENFLTDQKGRRASKERRNLANDNHRRQLRFFFFFLYKK